MVTGRTTVLCLAVLGLSFINRVEGSCDDGPCQNNATCIYENNTYTCICPSQYTGNLCEILKDPCNSDPCYNGGSCSPQADGFRCFCTENFLGVRCEAVRRYCFHDNLCQNDALCEDIHNGGYRCFCSPGFYGNHCEKEIDECKSSPCKYSATCQDEVNGYTCYCPPGRVGLQCETEVIDGCLSAPCINGGSCIESGDKGLYSCTCVTGFDGVHCQINMDDCSLAPCTSNQTCTDLVNGFRCDCAEGRTGETCEIITDACVSLPCQNSGTCIHDSDRYICNCLQGYAGINCEIQIDPCYPNPCHHEATCITNYSVAAGYTCNCMEHFVGEQCEGKVTSCQMGLCKHGGTCIENIYTPGYTCHCTSGYTGSQCEVSVDGCWLTGCDNGGTCTQSTQGTKCECIVGWTGAKCDIDVDECNLSPCYNGGVCINIPASYICLCNNSWTGQNCEQDITYCNITTCMNNGTCTEIDGRPLYCQCREGTTGVYCETVLDGCELDPCYNGAQCIGSDTNYTCQCLPGFLGKFCEENINECEVEPCMNGGTCEDGENDYICHCIDGYIGKNCSEAIDACRHSPCLHGGICSEHTVTGYKCDCKPGMYGSHCERVTIATLNGTTPLRLAPLSSFLMNSLQNRSKEGIENEFAVATTEVHISFWFTTSILHGTILSIVDMNEHIHLLVQLHEATLAVSVDMYGETVEGRLDIPAATGDVVSHHVFLTITTSYMNISIDNCQLEHICNFTVKYGIDADEMNLNGHLVIGGVDYLTPYIRSKLKTLSLFTGCVGNVKVNGNLVNLADIQSENMLLLVAGCRSQDLCHVNMCQNGGKCRDIWSTSYCECLHGYTGALCDFQQTAQFQTESFLHFTHDFTQVTSLSIWLTSNSETGVILYTVGTDMLCVYIDGGEIVLQLVVNGKDTRSNIDHVQNGDWYHLELQLNNGVYIMTFSDVSSVIRRVTGTVGNSVQIYTPLFMGKLHNHPTLDVWRTRLDNYTSYSGCVKNVTINDELIDLQSASASVFGNDPVSASPGCTRDSACSRLPCQHGATCISSWNNYTCHCTASFTGSHCELAEAVTLNGRTSYVDIHLNTSVIPFGDKGSFEFRTRDETVTFIFYQFYSQENVNASLEIGLYKANVDLTLSATNISRLIFKEDVSDGEWHSVVWRRKTDEITVTLDSTTMSMPVHFDPFIFEPVVRVFVGGKPYHLDNPAFMIGLTKGCIRNVSFNENNLKVLEELSARSGVSVKKSDVLPGCIGDNMCTENVCVENADCEDIWNDRVCMCQDGWHGNTCNISVDDCVDNLCSYGECVDNHQNYSCLCDNGYTGEFCDVIYDPCDTQVCFQNGTVNCSFKFPSQFECFCQPGWSGLVCSEDINECESNPCLNNSTCTDLLNDFKCKCEGNSFGKRCENIPICSSAPCFNGGKCSPNENNTDYTCSCLLGYNGKQCQVYDFCYKNICENNGSCVSSSTGFTCNCLPVNYGVYCQFIDYCASGPCLNNAVCHNDVTSFRCTCDELFSGETCDTPVNRCDKNMCRNGGTCFFNASDLNSNYICKCVEGFTGVHCETDINECLSNPCQNGAVCIESNQQPWKYFPGYHCDCIPGYTGQYCHIDISECESLPCKNNGTCVDFVNRFECKCVEGFLGEICEKDNRGCSSAPCLNNGVCELSDDSYTCVCTTGYTGLYCQIDIDNCRNNVCLNSATCIDGVNSYTCDCLPGYSGEFCGHVEDACFSQPCKNNGKCTYRGLCNCSDVVQSCGWYNESCQIDMCSDRSGCSLYTTAYLCNCAGTGFIGETCAVDVDECVLDKACEHNGICTNTAGSYTCDCKHTGYIGIRCEQDINECNGPNPCYNDGECKNLFGSFQCLCGAGWTGETCGELIDSCQGNPCKNGGVCINTRSGYICDCEGSGFQGDNCDINVNDCIGNPCLNNGRCIDGINSFMCDCKGTGFHGNLCENVTENCAASPCMNNGSCIDTGRSYLCKCRAGYMGVNCTEDINECDTDLHKCTDDSTCINTPGSYTCLCSERFTGELCDVTLQARRVDESTSTTGVVAASVIIIIIIIIILLIYTVWYIRKSRHMKGRYKPSQIEADNPPTVSVIPLNKIIDPTTGERLI